MRSKAPYTHIGWGFFFPTDSAQGTWNWDVLFGKKISQPIAFLGVFTVDDAERVKFTHTMDESWLKDSTAYGDDYCAVLAWMPLHELLESDNIRATFEEWIEARFEEALKAIS